MRAFIRKYRHLFLLVPVFYILGNIFAPLTYVLLFFVMSFWLIKGKHETAVIALILILAMGDSRMPGMEFDKTLRIIAILLIGVQTIVDLIKRKYAFRKVMLMSIPFFLVAIVGGLRSPEPGTSLSKMVSYFLILLVAFHYLPYHIKRTKGELYLDILKLAAWVLLVGLMFILINYNVAYLLARYRGLMGNPNGLGIYCTMIFMMMMVGRSLFPTEKRFIYILLGLILFSVLLSESRTSLGTIGIFSILYFFYKSGKARKWSLWLFFLPVGFLLFEVFDYEALLKSMGLGEYLRVESLSTGTGRYLAWEIGWRHIQENFWIGRGFAYEEIFFKTQKGFLISTEHQGGIHNSYLTFIMNNGIIGFILIAFFYVRLFSKIKIEKFRMPVIITVLISANFESWLTSSLNAFTVHFLVVLAILMNYYQIEKTIRK
ncbi:MAG: O-antigen ligase family protein [Bacteroidia bacterium]